MILYIELCNFIDHPLGGHLSFAKHLTSAMKGEMHLVGITTSNEEPIGKWFTKNVEGYNYSVLNIYRTSKTSKKPLIPNRIKDYWRFKRCLHLINFEDYEIIVVQTPEVLMALPNSCLSKVVLIMPGVENPLSISRYKIARNFQGLYDKLFFDKVRKVRIALAAADKQSINECVLRSRGKITNQLVVQFPTRYDSNIFRLKNKEQLRLKYKIRQEDRIFVTTGRLSWFKGWKFMIDSFALFHQHCPNSYLYFIGDGEDRAKIESYLESLDLVESVRLLGYQTLDTISDYLNLADLFMMGSYKEGWSTSLVEAVACGVPCVVTNFSSASEMVHDGINGYVLNERSEKEFAAKMEEALKLDVSRIRELAQNIQNYSVANMRKAFTDAINK